MSDSKDCNPDLLKQIMQGSLADQGEQMLHNHLEHCHACQLQLQTLAAQENEWEKLSEYLCDNDSRNVLRDGHSTVDIRLNPSKKSGYQLVETATHLHQKPDPRQDNVLHNVLQKASHPELLGRIDGFEVERVIGQGGMGVVYKGFDTELNRPVAIKVLVDHLAANGVARQRFAREARAAAAVIHPNVVPIHSVNSSADRPYIVMTLVSGRSLQSHISEQGPLCVKEVVRIAKQIASGLSAAHAQGLVHRDIKPANILLEKDVSRVMITDFGLARAADDAAITQTGWLAGTPHYMSPEQASGLEVDFRSDLFSLGSVMYFMSTGREPFRAQQTVAVLKKITTDQPEALRSVNSDMTKTLARIIGRLMAKDPGQRFTAADEVDQVLTQYLAHLEQPRQRRKPKVKAVRKSMWQRVVFCSPLLMVAAAVAAALWLFYPRGGEVVQPSGLQDINWQQEMSELDREISELESRESHDPTIRSTDWFADEVQNLNRDIQRFENGLNPKF